MPKGFKIKYTDEELNWIKLNAGGKLHKETYTIFSELFNRRDITIDNIKSLCFRLGIKASGDCRFKKGNIPFNKGIKGVYNVGGNRTSFKKGNIPHNHKPVGSERINVDGYIEVKVAEPGKWELKHRVEYKKHYGKLSKDDVVIFLDQNPLNLDINNLVILNRKELIRLNTNSMLKHDRDINKSSIGYVKLLESIRSKTKGE